MADTPAVVYMLDQTGQVQKIDASTARDAQAQGLTLASPDQARDYELEQKYGNQEGKAALEGGLRGLTFGLSDQVLTKSGAVTPEALKGRQEYNPATSTISEFAGAAAPMLIPGVGEAEGAVRAGAEAAEGASTLAKVARYAPSNLVSGVGKAAEHAVSGLMPEAGNSLAARMIAKAVPKTAGSAIDGALWSAGHEVSENALGDPNQTAESVLAHVGLGALFGGALGGLTGAAEEAVPAAVGRAKDVLADIYGQGKESLGKLYGSELGQKITGTSADTANVLMSNKEDVEKLLQQFPKMEGPLQDATPESAEFILKNYQKALTGDARKEMATQTREQIQELLEQSDKVHKRIYTDFAPNEADNLLQGVDSRAADEQVGKMMDKLGAAADQMRAEPELYNQSQTRALEKMQEGLNRDAVAGLTPAESFKRLSTLRQQIDEITTFDSKLSGISDRNTNKVLRGLRSDVRDTLHDESIWGEQGARKAALDDASNGWFKQTGKKSDFKKLFLDSEGKVSTTKMDTWINSLGKDKGQVGAEALAGFIDSARKVIDEAETSYKAAPVGEFDHEALTDLVNKSADQTQAARQAGEITAKMKYEMSGGMGIPNSGPIGAVADQAAGGLHSAVGLGLGVLHPVAGVAMAAAKALKGVGSVPRTAATLAMLERMGQKVGKAIESGTATLVKAGVKASYVGRGEVAAGLSRYAAKTYDDQVKDYEKTTEKITQLAQNFDQMHAAVTDSTSGLFQHAPQTAGAMQATQTTQVQFLFSKIPQHPKAGPLSPKWKPTPMEMGKFNRYLETVNKPLGILKKASAGTLMPEHVEALAAVYPQLHQKIQTQLIASLPKDPSKVPYASRRGIGMLLGQPMDGSFTARSIKASQAAFAPPAPAKGPKPTLGGLSKLTVSSRFLTPQQASAQRGGGE